MSFLKKNLWTICAVVLVVMFAMIDPASAQIKGGDNSLMGIAKNKAATTFRNVKSIIFVVGGFGLVLLAFGAIFGKVKWSAFASLAVGLAILAAAGAIVEYATGDTGVKDTGVLGDTFENSANNN